MLLLAKLMMLTAFCINVVLTIIQGACCVDKRLRKTYWWHLAFFVFFFVNAIATYKVMYLPVSP